MLALPHVISLPLFLPPGPTGPLFVQVAALLSKPQDVDVASSSGGLTDAWFDAFRVHQAFEVRWGCCCLSRATQGVCCFAISVLAAAAVASCWRCCGFSVQQFCCSGRAVACTHDLYRLPSACTGLAAARRVGDFTPALLWPWCEGAVRSSSRHHAAAV